MKTVLVFDDEILTWLRKELQTYQPEVSQNDFAVSMRYWLKILDWTRKENKFIRYMFHKKKRIQKKWDKIYNDRFKVVSHNPMMLSWLMASV